MLKNVETMDIHLFEEREPGQTPLQRTPSKASHTDKSPSTKDSSKRNDQRAEKRRQTARIQKLEQRNSQKQVPVRRACQIVFAEPDSLLPNAMRWPSEARWVHQKKDELDMQGHDGI